MEDFDIDVAGTPGPTGPAGSVTDGDKGDIVVTGSGASWAIDANAVDNTKAADMAQGTIKGRAAGAGTGDPTDLTPAQAKTLLAITASDVAGLGSSATLNVDVDGTMTANSDTVLPSQKAVRTYVAAAVTGTLKFKGGQDCSASANYPAAAKGDVYVVTVAGKIGGASGASVDVGDEFFATADNAGGTQAAVGGSWEVLEHNFGTAPLLATNNLSDLPNVATARSNLGLAPIAASGSGADLANASVTYAKLQNVAASSLVGNPTGTSATAQAITLAGGLTFSGTTLTLGAITPTSVAATGNGSFGGGAVVASNTGIVTVGITCDVDAGRSLGTAAVRWSNIFSVLGTFSGDVTVGGIGYFKQPAPTSLSAAATLTIAQLLTGIVQYTGAAATLTLPTGTLTDAGIQSGALAVDRAFEWSVVNTGSGAATIAAGTGHTIVGSATIAAGASGRFWTRKTAANTFVSYRTA